MKKKIKLTDKKNNSFVEVKCIRGRPRRIPTNHISLTTNGALRITKDILIKFLEEKKDYKFLNIYGDYENSLVGLEFLKDRKNSYSREITHLMKKNLYLYQLLLC